MNEYLDLVSIGKVHFVPLSTVRTKYIHASSGESVPLLLVNAMMDRPSTFRRRRRNGFKIKCKFVTSLDFCSSPMIC